MARGSRGGGNLGREIQELRNELNKIKRDVEELKTKAAGEIIDCGYCGGTGMQPRSSKSGNQDYDIMVDRNGLPVPCKVCGGKRKVRI